MILFKTDWVKEENFGAIIDTKTNNKSFLRVAGLLKSMNVENHAFMLSLLNPELQGVDPYSEGLTSEQQEAIAVECYLNPWYFFREVFRIPPTSGSTPIMLRANRANIAYIWLTLNHITSYLIQPRQTGKSLNLTSMLTYTTGIKASHINAGVLTKDDKLRIKTSLDIKDQLETLPGFLRLLGKKDLKNSERITVKNLNNAITLVVAQKDKKAADNLGRGDTKPVWVIDELAYLYNLKITLPVLLSSTTAAREQAKEENQAYFTSFATTPGKLNSEEGAFAYEVYNSALRFNEKYYDVKDEDTIMEIVRKNSGKFKVMLLEFSHRQLGFPDEWIRKRMEVAMVDGESAENEFLLKWMVGNTSSPIPKKLLEVIVASKKTEFNPFISKYGYVLKWYVNNKELNQLKKHGFIIIGLDTSDALGGENDGIGLTIRDVTTGAIVGAANVNETNLATYADFLVELLEEFPNSILVPERRSSAMAIMDNMFRIMLIKGMNPFKRIFNWVIQDTIKYKEVLPYTVKTKSITIEILNKYKKLFGFATSGAGETSRSLLYGNVFRSMIRYTADKTNDPELINQLSGLRIVNNRIDHAANGHDDMVIASLLSMWFLSYSKNKKLYGIKTENVLSMVVDNELLNENDDKIDKKKVEEQKRIKSSIESLSNRLKITTNVMVGSQLFNRIQALKEKIDPSIIKNFSIDALLDNIKIVTKIKKLHNK